MQFWSQIYEQADQFTVYSHQWIDLIFLQVQPPLPLTLLLSFPCTPTMLPAPAYQHAPRGARVNPTTVVFPAQILGLTIWSCRRSGSSAPISGHLLLHLFNYTQLISFPGECCHPGGAKQNTDTHSSDPHYLTGLSPTGGTHWPIV